MHGVPVVRNSRVVQLHGIDRSNCTSTITRRLRNLFAGMGLAMLGSVVEGGGGRGTSLCAPWMF